MNNVLCEGLGLAFLATLFEVMGAAVPYWWVMKDYSSNMGLFKIRTSSTGCVSYGSVAPNWLMTTQALVIIAILVQCLGLLLAVWVCKERQEIWGCPCAGLTLVSVIIFGSKINTFKSNGKFHAGFGLTLCSGIIGVPASLLLLLSRSRNVS